MLAHTRRTHPSSRPGRKASDFAAMDAPERGALMLVRFIAVALIGWSCAEIALYVVLCRHRVLPIEILPCVIRSLPFLAGVVILIKARPIAEWVAEKLD
jgi:hypothetical protein